jgi:CubicO group peptidase (beta-lactamase class C family)
MIHWLLERFAIWAALKRGDCQARGSMVYCSLSHFRSHVMRYRSIVVTLPLLFIALAGFVRAAEPKISSALQPFVDQGQLAGAVTVVATQDKVLSVDTVGYADIAAKKPIQEDSLFWIASMSKPITGAALMILVDEGKVSLDDPITKFLPEFKGQWLAAERDADHVLLKRPTAVMTVRHCMSHTSGLPFQSALEEPKLDGLPLRAAVASYAMTPLDTEPGTKFNYSNAGINTGGRIIEVVSGQSYESFLDQRLFEPLGMKDTTFWPSEQQVARLAKAYKPTADKTALEETKISQLQYPLSDRRNRYPMPGGGLFSTAADVTRFCQMVAGGGQYEGKRILSENAVKQMTSRQTPEALPQNYGVGWSTGPTFGHGGALSTNMTIDPQRGLITIFLVQHAGFPGEVGKQVHPAFVNAAVAAFGK